MPARNRTEFNRRRLKISKELEEFLYIEANKGQPSEIVLYNYLMVPAFKARVDKAFALR